MKHVDVLPGSRWRSGFVFFNVALAVWLAAAPALAQVAPARERLPNLDRRVSASRQTPEQAAAVRELRNQMPGARVDLDLVTGAPKMVTPGQGFLSGPGGSGGAVSAAAMAGVPPTDSHRPIKAFLNQYSGLYGHGAEALDSAPVAREFTTPHNGMRTVIWRQEVDGVPVFEALLTGHLTRNGELVSVASQFVPAAAGLTAMNAPGAAALVAAPPIAPAEAVALAAQNVGESLAAAAVTPVVVESFDTPRMLRFTASALLDEAHAGLVWLPLSRQSLVLCWEIILTSRSRGEMFRVLIDAQRGGVLVRHCLTDDISPATYRVYTSDSPSPFSPGHPTPLTNQPPLVARQLLTLSALNTNASPNGWIDDGVNETRGNNVDAHLDRDNNNQPDLPRPQGSPNRIFDFTLDLTQAPTTYGDASTVQLFYWNNFVHDKLYELGFTEAAGNFQVSNFSRGGLGNDAVQADAQDGGGFNNANFSTPPDGIPGRMQMYVFNGPTPDRDGDLDAEVVIHEYGHGLSNRRVGGGVGMSALQSRGMGEGWSDFYAMALLSEPGDNVDANYATGGYLTIDLSPGFRQNYYYGIRRYPYSTDLTKNPLTFKDIDSGQASPHLGVPMNPIFGPFNPSSANEVHNQGEVWCVTLWECRANLIRKFGATVGNQLMLQLVTDGMNLSPANPNMLQARDAILLADQVNNGGANLAELGAGFAKRGMGASATSPASTKTTGVHEAFDLEGLRLVSATFNDQIGGNNNAAVDPGEILRETIVIQNNGFVPLINAVATLVSTTPGVTVLQPTVSLGTLTLGKTVTNATPLVFRVDRNIACETTINFSLVTSANGRAFTNSFTHLVGTIIITSTATNVFESTNVPLPILDFATIFSSNTIALPGINYIDDVNVSVRLDHTFIFDLVLSILHPDGTPVVLSANLLFVGTGGLGTGACDTGVRTTYDDEAATSITKATPPFAGSFRPEEPLSALDGKLANGDWRLKVEDTFRPDSGTLQCWSLRLVTHQQIVVCSPFDSAPVISAAGSTLAGESGPIDGAVSAGETVTVNLALKNTGIGGVGNLIATLLPGGGVAPVSASQTYGVLLGGGSAVERPFTFTANGSAGGTVTATLQLIDGIQNLGKVSFTFTLNSVLTNGNPATITINDSGAATPYPSLINVSGVTGQVSRVTVNLTKFNHTFPDDVDVLLVSPAGRKVLLMSDVGGGNSVSNLSFTFDDAAGATLPDDVRLVSGTFKPTDYEPGDAFPAPAPGGPYSNSLAAFNGFSPNGAWKLFVTDDTGGDQGNIAGGWSLVISTITQVNPPGDVSVSMTASNSAVVGYPLTYFITVSNAGPVTANGVSVSDTLLPNLNFSSIAMSQGSFATNGPTVMANFGNLTPGGVATAVLTTTPVSAGLVTNQVTATASQTDTNLLNNAASAVTVISNPSPLIVTAGASITAENLVANGTVDPGETVTMTLSLRNSGTGSTTNLVATLLPTGGLTSVSGPQLYDALTPGGAAAGQTFTFTASTPVNGLVTATLQLQDGAANLGTAAFTFNVGSTITGANGGAIAIPQLGQAAPYPSLINLADITGIVSKVTVTFSNLTHSFPDDLDILLVGPTGERALLMSDAGGGSAVSGVTLTLDDGAANPLSDGAPLVSGTFRPADYTDSLDPSDTFAPPAPAGASGTALSVFNGANPNGAWSLYVRDDTGGDGGVIANGWRLTITTVSPVNPAADLVLSTTPSVAEIGAGSNLTFVVAVTNRGPSVANNVIITNPIPAFANFVVANASQGSVINQGGQLYASLGVLTNGASATLTFIINPQLGGMLSNIAGVFALESDYLLANNVQTTVVPIIAPPQAILGSALPQVDGAFQFMVSGQPGLRYVIEASTNLLDWTPISTNFPVVSTNSPAGGKITINDIEAVILPHRFYRARQQP